MSTKCLQNVYSEELNLFQVHAVDKDSGANSEIRYSLSPNQPNDIVETFQVDPDTGQVFTSRSIGFPGYHLDSINSALSSMHTSLSSKSGCFDVECNVGYIVY